MKRTKKVNLVPRRRPSARYTSDDLWNAIDRVAELKGISVSRMAIRSGLDASALNKSKRHRGGAGAHWPSMETVSLILNAMKMDIEDFAEIVNFFANGERT